MIKLLVGARNIRVVVRNPICPNTAGLLREHPVT